MNAEPTIEPLQRAQSAENGSHRAVALPPLDGIVKLLARSVRKCWITARPPVYSAIILFVPAFGACQADSARLAIRAPGWARSAYDSSDHDWAGSESGPSMGRSRRPFHAMEIRVVRSL